MDLNDETMVKEFVLFEFRRNLEKLNNDAEHLAGKSSYEIEKELSEWKQMKVNIAIIGNSGSGKSSLINAFLDLKADDDGAAPVGFKETTKMRKSYPHPGNKNITLWDVPGVGTPSFQAKSYLKDIEFRMFDFFIIVTRSRFTENDQMLVQKLRKAGRRFYFVKTHTDDEIDNYNKAYARAKKLPEEIMSGMRSDCFSNLKEMKDVKVFLIDNYKTTEYEFGELATALVDDALGAKREVLAFTMFNKTTALLTRRKELLGERTLKKCWSAMMDSDPGRILLEEVHFYRQQMNIDSGVEALANYQEKTAEEIKHELCISKVEPYQSKMYEEIAYHIVNALKEDSKLLKLLARLGLKGLSVLRYYSFLVKTLKDTYNDATKINEQIKQCLIRNAWPKSQL